MPRIGREAAVQDVIEAVIAARLLDGDEIVGFFHDADDRAVARRGRAIAARVNVRQVVADGAEDDLPLHLFHRRDETRHVLLRHPQDVKRQTLRGLLPHARQAL
jgi:hypothetical protein